MERDEDRFNGVGPEYFWNEGVRLKGGRWMWRARVKCDYPRIVDKKKEEVKKG